MFHSPQISRLDYVPLALAGRCAATQFPIHFLYDHYERAKRNYWMHKRVRTGMIKVGGKEFFAILNGELEFDYDMQTVDLPVSESLILRNRINNGVDVSNLIPIYVGNINTVAKTCSRRNALPSCLFEVTVRVLALTMDNPHIPISYKNKLSFLVRDTNLHYPVYRIIYPYYLTHLLPIVQSGTLIKCVGIFISPYVMRATRIFACVEEMSQ